MAKASHKKTSPPSAPKIETPELIPAKPDSGERSEVFARLRDLRNRALDAELNAEAYILAIDTGAIIAILSVWGKQSAISMFAAKSALTLFWLSTLMVAAVKIVRIVRAYFRMGTFEKAAADFLAGGDYLELFRRDRYARKYDGAIKIFGIVAMSFTVAGMGFAASNLWGSSASPLPDQIFATSFEWH